MYPDAVVSELLEATRLKRNIKPPKCIFVPEDDMVCTMVKAVAKHGHKTNEEAFFLRFGLLDDPLCYLQEM